MSVTVPSAGTYWMQLADLVPSTTYTASGVSAPHHGGDATLTGDHNDTERSGGLELTTWLSRLSNTSHVCDRQRLEQPTVVTCTMSPQDRRWSSSSGMGQIRAPLRRPQTSTGVLRRPSRPALRGHHAQGMVLYAPRLHRWDA